MLAVVMIMEYTNSVSHLYAIIIFFFLIRSMFTEIS